MIGRLFHRPRPNARSGDAIAPSASLRSAEPLETIEFRAFTASSVLRGSYDVWADRLTDALNRQDSFTLAAATVVDLQPLSQRTVARLVVRRDELLIVVGAGRRGNARRRFRAWPHAISLTLGPYRVQATIHTVPGGHPTAGIYHRQSMVPLTDATVCYDIMGRPIEETFETIIVNRAALTSIARTEDVLAERMRQSRQVIETGALAPPGATGPSSGAEWPVLQPSSRTFKVVSDPPPLTPPYLPRPRPS